MKSSPPNKTAAPTDLVEQVEGGAKREDEVAGLQVTVSEVRSHLQIQSESGTVIQRNLFNPDTLGTTLTSEVKSWHLWQHSVQFGVLFLWTVFTCNSPHTCASAVPSLPTKER